MGGPSLSPARIVRPPRIRPGGQADIDNRRVRAKPRGLFDGRLAIDGVVDFVAVPLQDRSQHLPAVSIVLDDKDGFISGDLEICRVAASTSRRRRGKPGGRGPRVSFTITAPRSWRSPVDANAVPSRFGRIPKARHVWSVKFPNHRKYCRTTRGVARCRPWARLRWEGRVFGKGARHQSSEDATAEPMHRKGL